MWGGAVASALRVAGAAVAAGNAEAFVAAIVAGGAALAGVCDTTAVGGGGGWEWVAE